MRQPARLGGYDVAPYNLITTAVIRRFSAATCPNKNFNGSKCKVGNANQSRVLSRLKPGLHCGGRYLRSVDRVQRQVKVCGVAAETVLTPLLDE